MASRRYPLSTELLAALLGAIFFSAGVLFAALHDRPYPLAARPGVLELRNDPGGNIEDHRKWYQRVAQSRIPVRIGGFCYSACTMVLRLPPAQVCIEPDAVLGFHLASTNGVPDRPYTKIWVRKSYPKAVQNWLHAHGALTPDIIEMDARTAVRLGAVHRCQ